jgi:hypothetical protein
VLFSGTPCQVAGLYNFLGKSYSNLTTVDLVCHGTPSPIWWTDSLKLWQKKHSAIITDIFFRDSSKWEKGPEGHIEYIGSNGVKAKTEYSRTNVYYDLFLKCEINRESCYDCPFANENRVADITLGDFWGFSEEYDKGSIEKEYNVDLSHGLNCVIINSNKGENAIKESELWLYETQLDKIKEHNPQLNHPSHKGKNRKWIFNVYRLFGYRMVDFICTIKMKVWKMIH